MSNERRQSREVDGKGRTVRELLSGHIVVSQYRAPTIYKVASFLQTQRGFRCNRCIETALRARRNGRVRDIVRKLALARKYYEKRDKVSCSIWGLALRGKQTQICLV